MAGLLVSTLQPLQKVPSAAFWLMLDLRSGKPIAAALCQLTWLPARQGINYKLCLLVHLSINGLAPDYLLELFVSMADMPGQSSPRSAGRRLLKVLRTKLKMSEREFSIAALQAWNWLPIGLKLNIDTVYTFTTLTIFTWITISLCYQRFNIRRCWSNSQ